MSSSMTIPFDVFNVFKPREAVLLAVLLELSKGTEEEFECPPERISDILRMDEDEQQESLDLLQEKQVIEVQKKTRKHPRYINICRENLDWILTCPKKTRKYFGIVGQIEEPTLEQPKSLFPVPESKTSSSKPNKKMEYTKYKSRSYGKGPLYHHNPHPPKITPKREIPSICFEWAKELYRILRSIDPPILVKDYNTYWPDNMRKLRQALDNNDERIEDLLYWYGRNAAYIPNPTIRSAHHFRKCFGYLEDLMKSGKVFNPEEVW